MARRDTKWPRLRKGEYLSWRNDLKRWLAGAARTRAAKETKAVLKKLSPYEEKYLYLVLFALNKGPRKLTSEQVARAWPDFPIQTGFDVADYVILMLAYMLENKTRCPNKVIAMLLNVSLIPTDTHDRGWNPEAVRQRRVRRKLWTSCIGPRFVLRHLTLRIWKNID
jgi:hypothetical protein